MFAKAYGWLKRRIQTFDLLGEYFLAVRHTGWDIAWGASVPSIVMGLWAIYGSPPIWTTISYFGLVVFVAGYYTWRSPFMRLLPKLELIGFRIEANPTDNPTVKTVYIQVIPQCSTDSSVQDCRGFLKGVSKWSNAKDRWEDTNINEPLDLKWSNYDQTPRTLYPNVAQRLNICLIDSAQRQFIPDSVPIPFRAIETLARREEIFRFDIQIIGKDCAPLDFSLRAQMGEEWDKPIVNLVRQVNLLGSTSGL